MKRYVLLIVLSIVLIIPININAIEECYTNSNDNTVICNDVDEEALPPDEGESVEGYSPDDREEKEIGVAEDGNIPSIDADANGSGIEDDSAQVYEKDMALTATAGAERNTNNKPFTFIKGLLFFVLGGGSGLIIYLFIKKGNFLSK